MYEKSSIELQVEDRYPEYSVTEISSILKKTVEDNFAYVRIKGEISGLKVAPSGHAYFSLKDSNAVLSAVCWRGNIASLKFQPTEGAEVVCTGTITTYPGQSKYQIIVHAITLAGMGNLMALLEQRKQQYLKEGLFAAEHKKPLPFLPQVIGIVTSPTGAVIQDIIHRISERFPVKLLVWPVLVQGEQSAKQVADAINGFNKLDNKPDLIIVARGGGSIEDLWSFNEDVVIRAAFASKIPLISAVGHETDVTLLDYVADKRAPTPTAAAEMAVPVREQLDFTTKELGQRIVTRMNNYLAHLETRLESYARAIPNLQSLLDNHTQRLDELTIRLMEVLPRFFDKKQSLLEALKPSLNITRLKNELVKQQQKMDELRLRLVQSYTNLLLNKDRQLSSLCALLDSYNYKNTLKRGFAMITDREKNLVTKTSQLQSEREYIIEVSDGQKIVCLK